MGIFRDKKIIYAIEFAVAVLIIIFDVYIPTLVVLGVMTISYITQKIKFSNLGFLKNTQFLTLAGKMLLASIAWSLFHLSFTIPILNRITGSTQNLSSFIDLQGNSEKLVLLLVLSWTLSAFGEEIVYRGYIQKTIISIFGSGRIGINLAIILSSILFGIAHIEQGIVGIVLTFLDALFFSYVKAQSKDNLWAPIFAHGFNNTTGLLTFYFVGPIYGLW